MLPRKCICFGNTFLPWWLWYSIKERVMYLPLLGMVQGVWEGVSGASSVISRLCVLSCRLSTCEGFQSAREHPHARRSRALNEFRMMGLESCPRRKGNVFSFSIFNTTYILTLEQGASCIISH